MKTFIPIECDIFNDDRMSALINKMGPTGYGVYMILLVELRNMKDYCLDGETLKVIARKYNMRRNILNEVLYNYNLFIVDTMPDDNIIVASEYVTEVMRNYDEKIEKSKVYGKKGADKRWAAKDSHPNGDPIATEKNKTEKNTSEEELKEEDAVTVVDANAVATPVRKSRWKDYLADAVNDRAWIECQAMHSGLGARFLQYQPVIVDLFANHVITHGKDSDLFSIGDVKYYFANFVRRGSATCKRIIVELDKLEQSKQNENPYRYETVDPDTGQRTFQGIVIPPDAPPRPNDNVTWSNKLARWI